MLVIGYHTKELALKAFAKVMSEQETRMGGEHPYEERWLSWMEWRVELDLITYYMPPTDEKVIVGLLWDIKGMFVPAPLLHEVDGTPFSYSTVFRV